MKVAMRGLSRAAESLDPDIRFRALYNLGLANLRFAARDSANRDRFLSEARRRSRSRDLLLALGDLEVALHVADGPEAAKGISNAKLIEYTGSAHGLFETDKQRLIDDVVGFLEEVGRGSNSENEPALEPQRGRELTH